MHDIFTEEDGLSLEGRSFDLIKYAAAVFEDDETVRTDASIVSGACSAALITTGPLLSVTMRS